MRYWLVLSGLLLGVLNIPAQSIGPHTDKSGGFNSPLRKVIPMENGNYVTVWMDDLREPASLNIRTIDAEANTRFQRELTLSEQGLPVRFEGAFRWGDRLTVLTSVYNPESRRNALTLRQYALPALEEEYTGLVTEAYTTKDPDMTFGYSLSPDRSQLLLYGRNYSMTEDPVRLSLHVLNRNLKKERTRDYLLSIKNVSFYLYGCLLDNSGNAYLLGQEFRGSAGRFSGLNERNIRHIILYGNQALEGLRKFVIEPGKLLLSGARFALDGNGRLLGAGLYRKRSRSKYEGFFTVRIDGPADRMHHHLLPVNKDQYKNAAVEVPGRQPKGVTAYNFSNFTVDHLIVRDSALFMTGEQLFGRQKQFPPFASGDILIAHIREYKRLAWIKRIPKRQEGYWEDLPKFSYQVFKKEDGLQLLYTNIFAPRFGSAESNTVLASADKRGRVTFKDITGDIEAQGPLIPFPAWSWLLGNKKLLILGAQQEENQVETMMVTVP